MMIFVIALVLVGAIFALAIIPKDGLGHRPAPRSHYEFFDPRNRVI
jgi:hypothetical protein